MIKIHISPETRFVHICKFSLMQKSDSTPQMGDTHYIVLKSHTLSNTFLHYNCKPYLKLLLSGSTIVLNQSIPSRSDITALRQKRLHDCQYVENCVCYLANNPSTLPIEKRFTYERRVFMAAGYKVNFTEIDENLIRLDYGIEAMES